MENRRMMRSLPRPSLLLALLLAAGQAGATLILDTTVTGSFSPGATWTNTNGNDVPGHPNRLYFGQLGATANGYVDFYYIGNEAAYTNWLTLGGSTSHSSLGLPDNFNSSFLIGTLEVLAGSFLDFDLCTNGGDSVGSYGRCVQNDNANSIIRQYNHNRVGGYRSIAYAGVHTFNPTTGARTYTEAGRPASSDRWMLFWDDSGARNDDNHDDYVAVASFRPKPVITRVSEPGTLGLAMIGLAGLMFAARRGTLPEQAR
jgi:hypothetical protein